MRAAAAAMLLLACGNPAAAADRPLPRPTVAAPGPICDDPSIVGTPLPEIHGADGCGVARPVEVSSIAGIALDPPTVITCGAARALRTWVQLAVKDALPGLRSLKSAGGYACRPRNNVAGAKISEHAAGRAIDIAGFGTTGGRDISVARDWNDGATGRTLRRIYAAGCGTFSTTLGPGADGFHQTHLHFDTERRAGGPFCQ